LPQLRLKWSAAVLEYELDPLSADEISLQKSDISSKGRELSLYSSTAGRM